MVTPPASPSPPPPDLLNEWQCHSILQTQHPFLLLSFVATATGIIQSQESVLCAMLYVSSHHNIIVLMMSPLSLNLEFVM